jgi:hypothetical protein
MAQARAADITAKTKSKTTNESTQEVIDTLLEKRNDVVYYIMMNVREHIIHYISAMTNPHLMCA